MCTASVFTLESALVEPVEVFDSNCTVAVSRTTTELAARQLERPAALPKPQRMPLVDTTAMSLHFATLDVVVVVVGGGGVFVVVYTHPSTHPNHFC